MTPEQNIPTIVGIFATLVAIIGSLTGVLIWLLKRLVSHTIPDLMREFKSEMKAERDSCDHRFEKLGDAITLNQLAIEKALERLDKKA